MDLLTICIKPWCARLGPLGRCVDVLDQGLRVLDAGDGAAIREEAWEAVLGLSWQSWRCSRRWLTNGQLCLMAQQDKRRTI